MTQKQAHKPAGPGGGHFLEVAHAASFVTMETEAPAGKPARKVTSTLNGGTDIDGWWAAHKDQIHPANQVMLTDLNAGRVILSTEAWMAKRHASYDQGANTYRVNERDIAPLKLYFVESAEAQVVVLDTSASYEMPVTYDELGKKVQSTTAETPLLPPRTQLTVNGKLPVTTRTTTRPNSSRISTPAEASWRRAKLTELTPAHRDNTHRGRRTS
jgi:hypothetical protein